MEKRFLTKKTKITIKEDKEPVGLRTAMKARTESGDFNKGAIKDFESKMSKYYDFDNDQDFETPKITRSDYEEAYEIEDLGAGKMSALKYDNEDTEVYKKFDKRIDDLNDTSEYDEIFGTIDGFGEGKKKDKTYDKLKDNSEKYIKHKYDKPDEYHLTPKVRVTNESKNDKMKRLNFKNKFASDTDVLNLIPENYKFDGHTFLMTDGNQTFKVRWDESINEGTILGHRNKSMINEDVDKMKKLFNYNYSDPMGKTNDYITESEVFGKLFKNKSLLIEQPITNTAFDLKISLPLNSQKEVDMNGKAPFVLSGLGNKASEEYTGIISSMTIGGVPVPAFSDLKLNGETITGNIWLKNDQKLYGVLKPLMGKTELFAGEFNYRVTLVRKIDPKSEQSYLGNITVNSFVQPTQK